MAAGNIRNLMYENYLIYIMSLVVLTKCPDMHTICLEMTISE